MKKLEVRPGRAASKIGILFGLVGVVFVIGWIGLILHLSWDDRMEPGVVFLLVFGLMFLVLIIVNVSFYVRSAFAKNRPSILDIEEAADDEINAVGSMVTGAAPDGDISFCPYCGKTFKKDFSYCQYCGKKIIM